LICAPTSTDESFLNKQQEYEVFKRALAAEAPEAARLFPEQLGNTTYFFFDHSRRVAEFDTDLGPPMSVLDQLRTGTSAEVGRRTKRLLRTYLWCLGSLIFLFIVLSIWHMYSQLEPP